MTRFELISRPRFLARFAPDVQVVPHAVFVDPEVASVGLTEAQARAAGHRVAVGRQEFAGVAKARAIGGTAVSFSSSPTQTLIVCSVATLSDPTLAT